MMAYLFAIDTDDLIPVCIFALHTSPYTTEFLLYSQSSVRVLFANNTTNLFPQSLYKILHRILLEV